MNAPPVLAERILKAVLPGTERDFVVGDLAEAFRARTSELGRRRAVLWYWGEVARSIWPLITYPGRWRGSPMFGLKQDLRGAFRVFRRAPGFAGVVILTLAIGVGGASAVYSVVRGVLLSPLPFEDPDRVVMMWGQNPDYDRAPLTVGDYKDLTRDVGALESAAAMWSNNAPMTAAGEPEQVSVGWVTPGYFSLLGVEPAAGRMLRDDDHGAIVISHDLWVRRFGADPTVIGTMVDLGPASFELAGVVPSDRNPNLTGTSGRLTDHVVWRLQPPDWTRGEDRTVGWLRTTARLRDGVTLAQAQSEVDAMMARINATITERDGGTDLTVQLVPVKADMVGGISRALWVLLAAVCGVLLIAASNVAHLTLARGEARGAEVALRTALGGSRVRMVRQLLVEGGVLAVVGGLAGLGVAWAGLRALLAVAPPTLPRLEFVQLDWGVFGFALAATAAATLVFALVPALRTTRKDLTEALGERHATGGVRRQRLSRGLVVAEVALSLVLLTATGLLLRSFSELHDVDLGFEREGVLTFALETPGWGTTAEEAGAWVTTFIERMESVPGVQSAAFTNRVPLGGGLFTGSLRSESMVAADAPTVEGSFRFVTPEYFSTMGAQLLAGRGFLPEDPMEVVLVDETTAKRMWPGEDPLGRRIQTSVIGEDPMWSEVVGVVRPMKHQGVAAPAEETVFMPMLARAHQQNFRYAAVRVVGDPSAYVQPLRESLREANAGAVIARVRTMGDLFDQDIASTRFAALLLSVFGVIALVLATVGLHGVMSFSVRRRSREIAIRVALGAEKGIVLRSLLASGSVLVLGGIVVGSALSLGFGRILRSLLFEVHPGDLMTLSAAAAVMLVVGLIGAYLPARLVLRVDPALTLREE